MNYSFLADEVLWKLVKISDDKAFAEVYRRYWKTVFQAAYYRVRSKEIASELVQDLFLRLWEKRETIVIQHVERYLQTAMKNSICNYIQSKIVEEKYHSFVREITDVEGGGSDTTLLLRDLNRALELAIGQLPPKTGQIFRLSRFEHLTAREIAQSMNLTEKAVEYHITKSLKLMRLHLKDFIFFLAITRGLM